MPSGSAVFLRLLLRELGTPKLAQNFAYGKGLYTCRILLHGVSDLDQSCLKTVNVTDIDKINIVSSQAVLEVFSFSMNTRLSPLVNSFVKKKLSCRKGTVRRFVSLNILLSHSRSLKVI